MAQAGCRGPGLRAKMAEEARREYGREEAVPAPERVARVYGDFKFPAIGLEKLAVYVDLKDPYIAAVAACVYGPDRVDGLIGQMEDPPSVNRGGEVARRWQIGRALWYFKSKERLSLPELARRLGHSHHSAVWGAIALYRAWPDGCLPEKGSAYYLAKKVAPQLLKGQDGQDGERAAVLEGRAVVRRLEGMDNAVRDLQELSRRVGRPLTAQEIERIAAKHRVSPLVLMGHWGNHVLASGAATTRDLVAALQAEKTAWQEEKAVLQKELGALRGRLASLEEQVEKVCSFFAFIAAAVVAVQGEGRRASA
ncbi:MAG: hypothetical protein ACPLRW_05770 [Moorellales bacterium]